MTSHLNEYLTYYKGCESPGYAVLVTGEWGVGKTFQVKQALAPEELYYVSLFGLQTADDVHSAVLALMLPKRSKLKSISDRIQDTSAKMGGVYALGGLASGVANALLRQNVKTDRTLVFDDLERCGLKLGDTLGIINTYVEHHGCRVVVIAHNEKLTDEFQQTKEKMVGQTLKVEPQVFDAFSEFISTILIPEKIEFLNNHSEKIIEIFEASGANSLRILKHVIEDLCRLYDTLTVDHRNNVEAISELVSLFLALNIEVRSGHLLEEDLKNRYQASLGRAIRVQADLSDELEESPFLVAAEKYASVDLESNLLQDTPIIEMLIEGRYDQDKIRDSLNNSPYFLIPQDTPPWKVVFNFDEFENEVVELALEKMLEQFNKREVTDSGEMLHIFSLLLMLAENGIHADDIHKIADDCETYVNDLLADNRLPPRETDWRWPEGLGDSYDGYGYWVTNNTSEHFARIFDHLIASREKVLENRYPEIINNLIELIKNDGQAFAEQVSITNNGENPFALIPILLHLSPDIFVEEWLESPKENWRYIKRALEDRYEGNRLNNELESEKDWVLQVVNLLEAKAVKFDGLQSLRIKRNIPSKIRKLAENV